MRLDQYLVSVGMAPSRTKAQELIETGRVSLGDKILIDKAFVVDQIDKSKIKMTDADLLKYVSRAGQKLDAVLREMELSVEGCHCLDVGVSTGGFTDCLLQAGAKSVTAFDVGHGQLAQKIKNDPRVVAIENLNVKDIGHDPRIPDGDFDLIVGDVSFISIRKVLPFVVPKLGSPGQILFLIKPQFEVGPAGLGKGGIVRTDLDLMPTFAAIKNEAKALGLADLKIVAAALAGRDGNQEYFLYAKRGALGS